MSVMKMVDENGRSMQMVDGVMSMGMMSSVELVISCHSFLHVQYYFSFWIFYIFIAFGLTVMVVIGFFFTMFISSFCSVLVGLH